MSHKEQLDFVQSVKDRFEDLFSDSFVLEIGSLDINGSVRPLFFNCDYVGVDLESGPGVDLIAQGQELLFESSSFDVCISTECFEHNPYWVDTFANMTRIASKLVIFTCATDGRPEHGTTRTETGSSPFTATRWDYYRNLTEQDFRRVFDIDAMFSEYEFSVNSDTHDLYFWGVPIEDKETARKKQVKVAVYTIALNEEKFVQRWYESAKDADYVFIADTGSTDGTVETARSLGIAVQSITVRPWRFDVARNTSLALLPSDVDYCIALDMDEVLLPGWKAHLQYALEQGLTRPRYQYTWNWNDDGSPGLQYFGDKIHSRFGYRWKHPVHEVIGTYGDTQEIQGVVGLKIHHYADNSKSRGQYFPMLKMAVDEDPYDDRNAFYYARELYYYGMYEEAIREFKRHLDLPRAKWPPERAASMRYLGKIDTENSEYWFQRAISEAPGRREPHVDISQYYYEKADWQNCLSHAKAALEVVDRPLEYLCEADAWSWKPYDLAAIASYRLGEYNDALKYGLLAVQNRKTDSRLQNNLEFYIKAVSGGQVNV